MNDVYYLMAENERGELAEIQLLKNHPLADVTQEARRLAGELKKAVYVMQPVFIARADDPVISVS